MSLFVRLVLFLSFFKQTTAISSASILSFKNPHSRFAFPRIPNDWLSTHMRSPVAFSLRGAVVRRACVFVCCVISFCSGVCHPFFLCVLNHASVTEFFQPTHISNRSHVSNILISPWTIFSVWRMFSRCCGQRVCPSISIYYHLEIICNSLAHFPQVSRTGQTPVLASRWRPLKRYAPDHFECTPLVCCIQHTKSQIIRACDIPSESCYCHVN